MKKLLLIPLLLIYLNVNAQSKATFHFFTLNVVLVELTVYEMIYKNVKDSLVYEKLEERKGFVKRHENNLHIVSLPLEKYYMIVFKNLETDENKDLYVSTINSPDELSGEIDIDFSTPHTTILKYEEKRNCYVFKVIDKK